MPGVPQMIRSVTRQKHVQQYIVEKDYALSYLLAAIVQTDGLGENLVLKYNLSVSVDRVQEDWAEGDKLHIAFV